MGLIRTKSITLAILAICCLIFTVVVAGCGGGDGNNTNNNNNPPPPPPPSIDMGNFTASNLSFSPGKIFIGETANISVTLYNGGGCDDTQIIKLYVDGSLDNQKTVSLRDEQTTTISFEVTKSEYGVYDVDIESQMGELLIWPLLPVPGEHDEGPFCALDECHGSPNP